MRVDRAREMLKHRKSAILGELSELQERRTAVMAAHERATRKHIAQMDKINDRMRELRDQAEQIAAQWKGLADGDDDHEAVPADFPVRPLSKDQAATATDPVTCGTCGRTWDDAVSTSWTPAPGGRCPFEYFHGSEQ